MQIHELSACPYMIAHSHDRHYNILTVNITKEGPPVITKYISVDIMLALFLTAIIQVKIGHKLLGVFHEQGALHLLLKKLINK